MNRSAGTATLLAMAAAIAAVPNDLVGRVKKAQGDILDAQQAERDERNLAAAREKRERKARRRLENAARQNT